MKKVVVKVKIKSRDEFEDRLSRRGVDFGPIYWQHDRVYLSRGYKKDCNFPRFIMRTEMKAVDKPPKYLLILKRHILDSDVEIEHATVVKDYLEAVGIIMQLGFVLDSELSRKRQEARLRDGKMLYLDNIEGISGYFVKCEAVINESDVVEKVRAESAKVFQELEENNFLEETYADLLKNRVVNN